MPIAQHAVGIAFESVAGTPVTPTDWIPFEAAELIGQYGRAEDPSHFYNLFGRGVDQVERFGDGATGPIRAVYRSKGFAIPLIEAIMGGAPVATPNSPAAGYTRRVYTKGDLSKTLTIQRILPIGPTGASLQTLTYPGSVINQATWSGSAKDFLRIAVDVLAREERDNVAAGTPAYTGLLAPIRLAPGGVTLAVTDIGGAVTTTVCYEAFEFTIGNGYTAIDTWCGKEIAVNEAPTIQLTLRNGDYSPVWWQKMTANTNLGVTLTIASPSDANTYVKFTAPACRSATQTAPNQASALRVRSDVVLDILRPSSGNILTVETASTT